MDETMIDAVIDVHLKGAFYVTQPAFRLMREQGYGRIISTSSASGLFGNFGQANYGAAKAGLAGLTRVLALEGAGHGIMANAIAPIAATQMTEGILGDLAVKVSPGSVSPLVAYLAHAECSVSGNVYSVAGGRIARIFVGETQGLVLGENTPESIRSALAHRRRRHRWTPPAVVAGRRDDHHRQGAVGGVLTRSAPMSPDVR
jgi:NAD(P)-dependent dehydrogenase (short-subunit alcohol dehydrogenase family)